MKTLIEWDEEPVSVPLEGPFVIICRRGRSTRKDAFEGYWLSKTGGANAILGVADCHQTLAEAEEAITTMDFKASEYAAEIVPRHTAPVRLRGHEYKEEGG